MSPDTLLLPPAFSFGRYIFVSGRFGVRLRTYRRVRRELAPGRAKYTQSINRRFVRWVYFALKRRGLKNLLSASTYSIHMESWAYPPLFTARIREFSLLSKIFFNLPV